MTHTYTITHHGVSAEGRPTYRIQREDVATDYSINSLSSLLWNVARLAREGHCIVDATQSPTGRVVCHSKP